MTDPVIFSVNGGNGELDRLGDYDDFALTENRSVDFAPGLVSLGFITSAIRRTALFWSILAVLGLVAGLGVYTERPHTYQASASVLLTLSPYENSPTVFTDNQAIAATPAVAAIALHELQLKQSVSSFLSSYTALSVTDRVITITASAPSPDQAVLRATAVGNAFLKFRADQLRSQQNLVLGSLNQQVSQASQLVNSIDAKVSQLSGHSIPAAQRSQLTKLKAEQASATASLTRLQQALTDNQATTRPAVTAAVKNSQILSVVPLPYSKKKKIVTYCGIGLVAGLFLGLGIVIVRALVSDRLRRRDDIAYVIDAPVRLSVGSLRKRPGRAARRRLDMRRVVAHLNDAVPRSAQGPAGLVIVAVDNAPVVARTVAAVAASFASRGYQVLTADLSTGAHLARLLRARSPGVHAVTHNGGSFRIAVPGRDDYAPVGPQPAATSRAAPAQAADALVTSAASADLLITLVTLDPALGAAHLGTWATSAVVVVSAGRSSVEKIHAVGEMIRLGGLRLDSVVLIGADKRDQSLGLARRPEEAAGIGALGH